MAESMVPSPDQVGTASVWFTTQAGISATILAVVCVCMATYIVWRERECRKAEDLTNARWIKAIESMAREWVKTVDTMGDEWARRIDQFRADVKEAFNQNDSIADRVVEALNNLKIEVARMSARRERD